MKENKTPPIITIDGPSGTGKGTICHQLANHLGWHILDSGVIYRALALTLIEDHIDLSDQIKIKQNVLDLDLQFKTSPHNQVDAYLRGKIVNDTLRSEQCGQFSSKIATNPEVRKALLEKQRAFAQFPGLVTDGRDMGTVVFPDAFLKIYLYASTEARASRRFLQLKENGNDVSLAEVMDDLIQRDARDTGRACAPLRAAPDAVSMDTTHLTVVQVFNNVLQLANQRLGQLQQGLTQ